MAQFPASIALSSLRGTTGFKFTGEEAGDSSGRSVSSAGDVNGDGFNDIIVGAIFADSNGSNAGAAYVVFGKAGGFNATLSRSSLNGAAGFKIVGQTASDYSGLSVSSAGDLNGDGFDDLLISAPFADPNGRTSGASYVVFGKKDGFGATLTLSSLNGSNGFKITGETENDLSGYSVSSAGDVNGDGIADLIIGAPFADPDGNSFGASYVVFGKKGSFDRTLALKDLDGTNGFKIIGEAIGDQSGRSVSSAGDVNGDGIADLIIGARFADPTGNSSGASYVVFGKKDGFSSTLDLSAFDGTTGFKIAGETAFDYSGYSVSSAGDINGDGFADVIVGANGANPNGLDSGASYVVFGKDTGFDAALNLSTLDGSNGFKINGEAANDQSGRSVSSAGDVNGDGFDDIIVGALFANPNGTDSGASYVVFGKDTGFNATLDLSSLDGTNGFRIVGENVSDFSGWSVSSAGDMNGDGFADIIVGAPGADPNGSGSGASYVVFGRAPDTKVDLVGTKASQTLAGGALADKLEGMAGDDRLYGNGGADLLDGGTGADTMIGGAGDDIYIVDNLGDKVVEVLGGGTDTVRTSISYALSSQYTIDNLFTDDDGGTAAINLTGNVYDNVLTGNDGANVLDGKGDADTMIGRAGSDTYVVDNVGDRVIEAVAGGRDTVLASTSYTLQAGQEIEAFQLLASTGSANLNLTGNEFDQTLVGNNGANVLNGGAGRDTMTGRGGDDTYVVDNAGDRVVEASRGGTDTVQSSISYVLSAGQEIEVLQLLAANGSANLNLTGNEFNQSLVGNNGANVLNGGAGRDTMTGRGGDDTYVVDNAGDRVVDAAGGGRDTVLSSVSYTLAAGQEIEALQLLASTGSTALSLTGNEFGQTLVGNNGANVLNGGLGADVLIGRGGADSFVFSTALGARNLDRIADFSGEDTIRLSDDIFAALAPGQLAAGAFKNLSLGAADANDRILYNQKTGDLWYDADGSGSAAGVKVAVLDNKAALTAADFLIV